MTHLELSRVLNITFFNPFLFTYEDAETRKIYLFKVLQLERMRVKTRSTSPKVHRTVFPLSTLSHYPSEGKGHREFGPLLPQL